MSKKQTHVRVKVRTLERLKDVRHRIELAYIKGYLQIQFDDNITLDDAINYLIDFKEDHWNRSRRRRLVDLIDAEPDPGIADYAKGPLTGQEDNQGIPSPPE
jgi:hypothetical protein